MNATFEALVDPTRRHILELLRVKPRIVGELVDLLHQSQPGISRHLRVLREAGLVDVRQHGQRRQYQLRAEPLAEVDEWLKPFHRAMETRYERLDDLLDTLQQEENDNE